MAQFTKKAIAETFVALLNEKPFDKITVTDIVNTCGINRNTFYYHYQDLYALVDDVFRMEAERLVDSSAQWKDLKEGFVLATEFARNNKTAVYHLYRSQNRESLERYLYDVAVSLADSFLRFNAQGRNVSDHDIEDLAMIYAAALKGVALQWVAEGMPEDTEARIDNASRMLGGITDFVLDQASAG